MSLRQRQEIQEMLRQRRLSVLSDLPLSRRLERAEGAANARFVEARGRLVPDSGAQWIEVAGAYAMYDGAGSPCTQTFGLGLFQLPSGADLDRIETFFTSRGAPVFHEVSPLADKALLELLNQRGYQPVEFTSVMFLPLAEWAREEVPNERLTVRVVETEERDLWAQTAAEGWSEFMEIPALTEMMKISASKEDAPCFLAELDGQPIAAAALAIHDGVVLLAGASTKPEWRRRGAQRALFESRLEYAARAGCDLAMICAEPGGTSQRNAERQGFRIAYTRVKWRLKPV